MGALRRHRPHGRVGLNFTERGYGLRGAVGCSDRGWSAASQLAPGDVNWKQLFEEEGVRWFHCGGIFAALSATTADLVIEAMEAARAAGTVISYDLNFRASLWKSQGGIERAVAVNRRIASLVDVMIGNEEDFTAALGFQVPGMDEHISKLDPANFRKMIAEVVTMYPNFKAVATTLRNAKTATLNDWGAILWTGGEFYEAPATRESGNLRPRRRRRQLRLGPGVRFPGRQNSAGSGAVRRGARSPGDDHPGRYQHGVAERSGSRHERQGRASHPVGQENQNAFLARTRSRDSNSACFANFALARSVFCSYVSKSGRSLSVFSRAIFRRNFRISS